MPTKAETVYQRHLIEKLTRMFPGCYITQSDPFRTQGIPDLLILFGERWAMLEVKKSANEPYQPNQEYYINHFNQMSFTSVIYPENEEQVLSDLQSTFGVVGKARAS